MVSYGSVECRWNHHDVARGIAMIKPYLKLGIFSFFRGRSLLDKGLRCLTIVSVVFIRSRTKGHTTFDFKY